MAIALLTDLREIRSGDGTSSGVEGRSARRSRTIPVIHRLEASDLSNP
ncbi:hypothetical protein ACFY0N_22350 [Streptomyces vinaceus]